ncbi:MAG: hypothetical protein LBE12_02480 [Planctomycetaceae bacterium]|jgi:hypothetical protein|nr:hypothetical protein [Planctomycetaceae bacterium]
MKYFIFLVLFLFATHSLLAQVIMNEKMTDKRYLDCKTQYEVIKSCFKTNEQGFFSTPQKMREELDKLDKLISTDDDAYVDWMVEVLRILARYKQSPNKEFKMILDEYSERLKSKSPQFIETYNDFFAFYLNHLSGYGRLKPSDVPKLQRECCGNLLEKWSNFYALNPRFDPELPENKIDDFFTPPDIPENRKIIWVNGIPASEIKDTVTKEAYHKFTKEKNRIDRLFQSQMIFDNIIDNYEKDVINYVVFFYSFPPSDKKDLQQLLLEKKVDTIFTKKIMEKLEQRKKFHEEKNFRIWYRDNDTILCFGGFVGINKNKVRIMEFFFHKEEASIVAYPISYFSKEDQKIAEEMDAKRIQKNEIGNH